MDPEEIKRIEALFEAAVELPKEERATFLRAECRDVALRDKLEVMLEEADRRETMVLPEPFDELELAEKTGSIIGRYKLLQQIGEGGFGVVYMAEQQRPVVRRVALKIIKLGMDTKEVVARFEAERQALAMMDHPNIARVLDGGTTETGRPYFVMELVRGVSITEYCDQNKLSPRDRLELFRAVCHAVQHAHHKGVIHRDIKPSNVMVTLHDGQPVPKVIDFGVAKAMHTRLTERTLFTAYHRFIGTPAYMSPEQAELSSMDVDTRTDIYALGVLLYELLTGTTPFDLQKLLEDGLGAIQKAIREDAPERPSLRISTSADASIAEQRRSDRPSLSRLVRGDLDWIAMKCLEKERARRYDTAGELAADIERHLAHRPVIAGPPGSAYRFRKFLSRNRAAVASFSLVSLALLAGITATSAAMLDASRKRKDAEIARQHALDEAAHARAVENFLLEALALTDPTYALDSNLSVLTVLRAVSGKVGTVFENQPDSEARLRMTLGRAYRTLGKNELAESHLRRALEIAETSEAFSAAQIYRASWDLTHVLFGLERPDAMAVGQDARRVAHDWIRVDHPQLAEALDRFVVAVNDGAFAMDETAIEKLPTIFEETVKASDQALPDGHPLWPVVADTWMAAGYSLWYSPYEPLAESFYRRALEIQRRELPPDHPQIGDTVGLLVGILNRANRAEDAEKEIRRSVERLRRVVPKGNPSLATAESMLGANLSLQGRFDEAQTLLIPNHQIIVDILGDRPLFLVVDSYARVINLYDSWGKPDEAESYRQRLADHCIDAEALTPWPVARCAFPPNPAHLELLDRLEELCGGFYYDSRSGEVDDPEVETLIGRLDTMDRGAFTPNQSMLAARHLLGWSHSIHPLQSIDLKKRMVEMALAWIGRPKPNLAFEVAAGQAILSELSADRDPDDSARHAREAWDLLKHIPHHQSWIFANQRVRIARCLVDNELYSEAESLLVPTYQDLAVQFRPDHPQAKAARALLIHLYHSWGRPEQARPLESISSSTNEKEKSP